MAQTFVNSYSPMTPIGAAMQNMSLAMFGGKSPIQQDTEEAKIANYLAHAEAQRQAARKHGTDADINQDIITRRGADRIEQDVAFRSGRPLTVVRAIKSHLMDGAALPPEVTPDDVRNIGQIMFSHQGGFADRTYDPRNVEGGIKTGLETSAWTRALVNPGEIPNFGRAQNARLGHGEFTSPGGTGMVLNSFTGGTNTDNPLARAVIDLRKGQTNQANAAAGASGSLTRQRDLETRTGVRLGSPVLVDDPEVGPVWTSPSAAVGRAPAAKPVDRAEPRAANRRPLTKPQMEQVTGAISSLVGVDDLNEVDPQIRNRIVSRATELATDPTSDYHQNPVGAAEAAVAEVAPQGFEKQGTVGFRKYFPKGAPAAPGGAAPQQPGQPAAAKRPAGKTDAQLMDEANAAIARGANKEAVMKRLQEYGVQVH